MNEHEFHQILDKYRDESSPILDFQPDVERLINSNYCKNLDIIIHGSETRWERMKAVESLGASLPEAKGVYMFVWMPDFCFRFASQPAMERLHWVLYVGKAGTEGGTYDTIKHRYLSEYSKYVGKDPSCLWEHPPPTNREQRLSRYLTLRPLEYWFLSVAKVSDIELFERKLIRLLQPPLNRQHGPKIRPGKPVPAFEEPK